MKKNVLIVLGSLLFLAVFFVFALGTIVEQGVAATEESSWIEAGYVPAASCGRPLTGVAVEPVSLGVSRGRLALVPAAGLVATGGEAGRSVSVVTGPEAAGSVAAAGEAEPAGQILLQPTSAGHTFSTPGLLADGPVSRSSDSGRLRHLRVYVINTEAAGQVPYPGVVRNLMALFFDWEPGHQPVQPVVPAV